MPLAPEQQLRDDTRFLGTLLGDTIRSQEGQATFDLIENIRKLSVAYHRDADTQAGKALDKILKGLTPDKAVSVIRAFTYFSHLANLAEDQFSLRLMAEENPDTAEGSLVRTFQRLKESKVSANHVRWTSMHSWTPTMSGRSRCNRAA